MTFGEMLRALRRHRVVVAVVTVVALLIAAGAATIPETKYEARATLLAQPDAELVDFASVEAVRFLLPSIAQLVSTNTFRAQIGERLDPPLPATEVEARAEFEPGTGIVHVTGTDTSPSRAQQIAQVGAVLLGRQELSAAVSITLLDPPELPTSPAGPGTAAYLLGGLVLGLLGGVLLAIVLAATRRAREQSEAGVAPDAPGSASRTQAPQAAAPPPPQPAPPAPRESGNGARSIAIPEPAASLRVERQAPPLPEHPRSTPEPTWASSVLQAAGETAAESARVAETTTAAPSGSPLAARLGELGLDVLASIPTKGIGEDASSTSQNGAHGFDGAFRSLAERLVATSGERTKLVVTSPRAGAGRTTVAANAAWALALTGARVVAVDGDVENPMLHRFLRVAQEPGLVDVQRVGLPQARQRTALAGLAVVAAGTTPDIPADGLEHIVPALLRGAADELVVIDGPALLDSPRAAILTQAAGAAIVVVDAADPRSPADVATTVRNLANLGVDVLGVVLNRTDG